MNFFYVSVDYYVACTLMCENTKIKLGQRSFSPGSVSVISRGNQTGLTALFGVA